MDALTPGLEWWDTTGNSLRVAAAVIRRAADACRTWEDGGDADTVIETAAEAKLAAEIAIEAVTSDEQWDNQAGDPETRRGRLAYAGWLLLLAGTDEHGRSLDLRNAAQLFDSAAKA